MTKQPLVSSGESNHDDDSQLRLPPPPDRLFRVAAGLETWSQEEEQWIAANPKWYERELQIRLAFKIAANQRSLVPPIVGPRPVI